MRPIDRRNHRPIHPRNHRRSFPALSPFALALVLGLTLAGGCTAGAPDRGDAPAPTAGAEAAVTDPTAQLVQSRHGAVATASVWASEVGARVLAEGGNAADAAVAAAWALAVTEPSMSGIGGRASILVRTADGAVSGIDGLNQVPRSYRENVAPAGYDRAAIPGVPAALARLHAEHGSWPMARLLAPAIRLASEGFLLPEPEAGRFAGAAEDLRLHSPEAAPGTYLRADGSPWPAGTRFRQPELARTLQAMADDGVEVFYRGWVADSIDADMRRRGAFVTRDELAAYEALPALPVEGEYRGHRILSNFRPASGHAVIQALQTLEAATPEGAPRGARWAALLGQAMEQSITGRSRVVDGSEEASARLLTSREFAREQAVLLRIPPPSDVSHETPEASETPETPEARRTYAPLLRLTPPHERALARSVAPHVAASAWTPGDLVTDPRDRESTTHLTVIDAGGMIVSLTQSLGPSMGARVVAPGLGFVYATRLGAEPGSRPGSTIAPTVVLRPDGSLMAGLGGAGDARILSAVIQTVSRMIDHGMSLDAAVAAPRVHPDGQGDGGELRLRAEEGPVARWTAAELQALAGWGFEVVDSPSGYFGRVHAVGWDPVRTEAFGVAEPRWDGGAAAPAGSVSGVPR